MLPEFANLAGFWALLGVPAILAIHFLQQRRRQLAVSTLFLIDPLAPESRGGRTWDRLRSSRALWLQLLAVLLATWVLVEPRWVRAESAQTVAVVLDSSASMAAFRPEAERAVTRLANARDGRAARTEWLFLTSDPRQAPIYRGTDRRAALAALAAWHPALGTHDPQPALRLAHTLAGANGLVWFVTDARVKVPAAQPALGVGRVLANVGFAGARVESGGGSATWHALVKNHTDGPQRRSWWVEAGGARTPEQVATLGPGALLELSGRLPEGVERAVVVLEPDEFALDDRLPLVRPAAKPLPVSLELGGDIGKYFQRLLGTVDGVTFQPGVPPRLRVLRLAPDANLPAVAAVVLHQEMAVADRARVLRAPVVMEKHPLLADLNWQGWLGSGPGDFTRAKADQALLWQNERALAWLTGNRPEAQALVLNFDWDVSNAMRLPAAALLVRRHVENVQDAQAGTYAANFDTLSAVALAERDRAGAATMEFQPAGGEPATATARTLEPAELAVLRAPEQPGFFVLRRGDSVLVRGAAHFADPRQADFGAASTFATGEPAEAGALFRRNTRPDPFTLLWLALAGLALLASWWPAGGAARDEIHPVRAGQPAP
ncbi:MAG TPA: BatA domain-containing protein [Lacunisphaera sp.]|nr:BatA domain-containing protein [Lacunisphaera sp.]